MKKRNGAKKTQVKTQQKALRSRAKRQVKARAAKNNNDIFKGHVTSRKSTHGNSELVQRWDNWL